MTAACNEYELGKRLKAAVSDCASFEDAIPLIKLVCQQSYHMELLPKALEMVRRDFLFRAYRRSERDRIERAAKAIYQLFEGHAAHPWVEGGNSFKQDEARRYARAALEATETT